MAAHLEEQSMASILDTAPYPWEVPAAQELQLALARLYPNAPAAVAMMQRIGIQEWEVALDRPAIRIWHDILERAAGAVETRSLVEYTLKDLPPKHALRPFLQGLVNGQQVALD